MIKSTSTFISSVKCFALDLYPQVFFFCVKEPADGCGGETPLVKNSDLLSSLDPDIVRRFEEKQLRYVCYLPDKSNAEYMNWQHSFYTDNREVHDIFYFKFHFTAGRTRNVFFYSYQSSHEQGGQIC